MYRCVNSRVRGVIYSEDALLDGAVVEEEGRRRWRRSSHSSSRSSIVKKNRGFTHVYLSGGNVGKSTRVRFYFELEKEK